MEIIGLALIVAMFLVAPRRTMQLLSRIPAAFMIAWGHILGVPSRKRQPWKWSDRPEKAPRIDIVLPSGQVLEIYMPQWLRRMVCRPPPGPGAR